MTNDEITNLGKQIASLKENATSEEFDAAIMIAKALTNVARVREMKAAKEGQ